MLTRDVRDCDNAILGSEGVCIDHADQSRIGVTSNPH